MTDLKVIKRRILREEKLEDIYMAMGCDYFNMRGNRVEASLPEHFHSTNKRSVQTKLNESLSSYIRNLGDFSGDIFFLVSYLVHNKRGQDELLKDLPNAKRFICETLGWREYLEGGEYEKRTDYLAPMKAILKNKQRKREVKPNPVLPESVLDEYLPYPSYDWLMEGISYETQKMYDIRFDLESKRIIIPMRNRFGKLIGVKGRILHDEDDERKYMYLHTFNNSQELFNFHFAHPYILIEKKVYLFEGEKSVMKMFGYGIYNCLAIGSSDLTDVQAEIIKQCGLDIEIILCYDSDKLPLKIRNGKFENKNLPDEVKRAVELLANRKVYGIIDISSRLREKSSPIDSGIEVFRELERENCYSIDIESVRI